MIWLRRKSQGLLTKTTLRQPSGKLPLEKAPHIEAAMFHVLASLHCDGHEPWITEQTKHVKRLLELPKRFSGNEVQFSSQQCREFANDLGVGLSETSIPVLKIALSSLSLAVQLQGNIHEFTPWIRSFIAPNVTGACMALTNLSDIPSCVVADILLRTPLTPQELHLQLDLWQQNMALISKAYYHRSAYVRKIIRNLLFYTIHHDMTLLANLVHTTLSFLTSKRLGYAFNVLTDLYINSVIYEMATYSLQHGYDGGVNSDAIYSTQSSDGSTICHRGTDIGSEAKHVIKAQKYLAKYLVKKNAISQKGYLGIVLMVTEEDQEQANKLFGIAQKNYPEHSCEYHYTNIHVSQSPELLFQSFNTATLQYPNSASLWYIFVRKLVKFDLLTEARSHKLLSELLQRKDNILISKDLILLLLGPIDTISGMEKFIASLKDAELLMMFYNSIIKKYMVLLFKHSLERSVRKPFMELLLRSSSNIECARFLYSQNTWKTTSCVGVMLNGEVDHQPENLYKLYRQELVLLSKLRGHGPSKEATKEQSLLEDLEFDPFCSPLSDLPVYPSEGCLVALLRGSMRAKSESLLIWGNLHALQVAVHEFKKYVCSDSDMSNSPCLFPSNKLWRVYLYALIHAGYMMELADVIRWWVAINFVPEKTTLVILLLALPQEAAERYIQHAAAVPSSTNMAWPWPTIEQVAQMRTQTMK